MLPPFWHWLFFLTWPARDSLGADGHPSAGPFLPPLAERTRMWAGGRLWISDPCQVGCDAERTSQLQSVAIKQGRSGELAFVTVRREVRQRGRLVLTEEQDLVYRSGPVRRSSPTPAKAPPDLPWQRPLWTDPVTLFGFSALTANTHRIHYDQDYARDVEGYPGLVVPGPLLALGMAELARSQGAVASLRYRLLRPAYTGAELMAVGDRTALFVVGATGEQHAQAECTFV